MNIPHLEDIVFGELVMDDWQMIMEKIRALIYCHVSVS